MQIDPVEEWRRLTALYAEMGDVEIGELVAQINDLTPTAQQILRDEMKKRGIVEARGAAPSEPGTDNGAQVHYEPTSYRYAPLEPPTENDEPHEFTWKTPLCECDTNEQVWQLTEALRRADIDSWIDRPQSKLDTRGFLIRVAADQLEEARGIASQPIPQDIVDESRELDDGPGFENPVCPKCRAADPTLESVDPSNNWLCESCGHTWSDPLVDDAANAKASS